MILKFDNKIVCNDALSILIYYLMNFAVCNEKEKIKKAVLGLMSKYFAINFKPI
jgi:hypothetical protein